MRNLIFAGALFLIIACNNHNSDSSAKAAMKDSVKSILTDSPKKIEFDSNLINIHNKIFMDSLKPVFGYRFVIKGDFDGDGKQETLTEHYKSGIDNKEAYKFYSNLDYDQTVRLTDQKAPYSYISSSDTKIDSLFIANTGQFFGLALLHNEGDLDGNGTDEISYVIDYADWSNLNSCHIMTYTKTGWKELLKFDIHESEIPELPQASASYGLFGVDHMEHYEKNDTLNQRLEKQLKDFSLIRKIKNNVIEVLEMCSNPEDENDSIAMGDDFKKIIHLKK
ncbi:MAG: hypothetical protein ACXVPU_19620 [Bacteroidia bacterium]